MGSDDQAKAYHRVLAGEIRPGMRVARHRTHTFHRVTSVRLSADTIWIHYADKSPDRPRHDARWWMEMPDEA